MLLTAHAATICLLGSGGMNSFFECKDQFELVPEGRYQVAYAYHETWVYMGRQPKVTFWFLVVDQGEYLGVKLARYFNVKRHIGKPSKNGRFVPGRSSDFLLEYCSLFADSIKRLDRIPLAMLKNEIIEARVKTVKQNREQRNLPDVMKYSVIESWLGIIPR